MLFISHNYCSLSESWNLNLGLTDFWSWGPSRCIFTFHCWVGDLSGKVGLGSVPAWKCSGLRGNKLVIHISNDPTGLRERLPLAYLCKCIFSPALLVSSYMAVRSCWHPSRWGVVMSVLHALIAGGTLFLWGEVIVYHMFNGSHIIYSSYWNTEGTQDSRWGGSHLSAMLAMQWYIPDRKLYVEF